MLDELKHSFSEIFEPALIDEIASVAAIQKVAAGDILIDIGQQVRYMPLLLSGAIKILREDEEGDELLLYFLEQGDTCSMTMTCCLGNSKSEIRAIAETDTTLVMIPVQKMETWTGEYKSWRNFVFESYHNRLNELLHTVDSIAFKRMDERLEDYLLKKAEINNSNLVSNTHREIAYDLHSSRVVISRLLKKMEKLGKIKMHRNAIEVVEF